MELKVGNNDILPLGLTISMNAPRPIAPETRHILAQAHMQANACSAHANRRRQCWSIAHK